MGRAREAGNLVLTHNSGRIGLVVDHPLRDLDAAALIAHLLAARGHETVLMPFYGQNFDLGIADLDLLVLNYARSANLGLIRHAQSRGIPLAVLDTEGGLLPEEGPTSPEGIARFLVSSGLDRDLSAYLFWGTKLRDRVVAASALDRDRATVVGCPRLDLTHEPWSGESRSRDVVLINTNFPLVNSAHATDGEIDRGSLLAIGFAPEEIDGMVRVVHLVMDRVTDAVSKIAVERPDRRFVLRPHPFEREDTYHRRFAGIPNIKVRREGNVHDAIAESVCMLHVNCTTAIEAGLSGVPPISLDFANEAQLERFAMLPTAISHRAGSVSEALALIDSAQTLEPLAHPELIEPHFGPLDGRGTERAAEAIEASLRISRRATTPPGRSRQAGISHLLGSVVGSKAVEALRRRRTPGRAAKDLSPGQVEAALAHFAAAQGVSCAKLSRLRAPTGAPSLSLIVSPA